jgi:hypothetical protein
MFFLFFRIKSDFKKINKYYFNIFMSKKYFKK